MDTESLKKEIMFVGFPSTNIMFNLFHYSHYRHFFNFLIIHILILIFIIIFIKIWTLLDKKATKHKY